LNVLYLKMMILVHKKILKFQKWVTNKEIPFLKKKILGDLINSRGLEILMKNLAQRRHEDRNEKGLFHLFFNESCLRSIQAWINAEQLREGKKKASQEIFDAYIGLEQCQLCISALSCLKCLYKL
jgi:hypothetical protein